MSQVAIPVPLNASGYRFEWAQDSIAGSKAENEDRIGLHLPEPDVLRHKGLAALVADGVSQSSGGGEAAALAVQGFLADYYATPDTWTVKTSAYRVLAALNRWLHGMNQRSPSGEAGLLCTLSALIVTPGEAHIFHIGDCRVYRLRGSEFQRITQDHRIRIGGGRTLLQKALGGTAELDLDYHRLDAQAGDRFLLLSDGVHDVVCDAELRRLAREPVPAAALVAAVVALAAPTSTDNISCLCLELFDAETGPDAPPRRLHVPPPQAPGDRLDHYTILERLHESTRSELYLARDEHSGARVVLKLPSLCCADDEDFLQHFLREQWLLQRLNNRHIVRLVAPSPGPALYYAMEYLDGGNLRQWMLEHPSPDIRQVISLITQLGRALQALHRLEIFHLDLKPENVMLLPDGTLKLIDLGSAYTPSQEARARLASDLIKGSTANYTAPEIIAGGAITEQADLFSLAVMSYELLCGQLPYEETRNTALSQAQARRYRYRPAQEGNPLVPLWMNGALRKGCAPEPSERHASLADFLHELREPNPAYFKTGPLPLAQRYPERFWQTVCFLLVVLEFVTIALFVGR